MKTSPIVSIVITFYNTPKCFFKEAIESVLAQTYSAWELFLVDDGSSDQSTHLAKQYAERDSTRIHYLEHDRHENRGMSASRQLGIARAHGEYMAFLDSDDVWLPNKLEEQVAILERCPEAGMLYGNTLYWSTWSDEGARDGRDFMPRLGVAANRMVRPPELLPLFLRGEAAVPCSCSVFVRKELIERTGGFEDRFRGLYEDQVFYAKMCLHVPVYVSDQCWDKYRQHPGSSCATAGIAAARAARIEFLTWLENYLADCGQRGGPVWDAVQEEVLLVRLPPSVRRALKPVRRLLRKATSA